MQDSQIVRMELKYCECCGGLLLRPAGTEAIYCAGCAARIRELAPSRMPKRRRRPLVSALPQVDGEAESVIVQDIHAVAALPMEGGLPEAWADSMPWRASLSGYAKAPEQVISAEQNETGRIA
jgi:hypothetical protein